MMTKKITIISPCYNEADVILSFYDAVNTVLHSMPEIEHEIILVDDGSSDNTPDILNKLAQSNPNLKVLIFSRNFGHQIALTAGIDHAAGDALIMMDSDLQHPVEIIPQLIDFWKQGYDIVSTIRVETQDAGILKSFTSRLFYILFNKLSPTYLPPGAADFCLLSKKVYSQMQKMRERHRFLRGLICWLGFNKKTVPYTAAARKAGSSKYSPMKMIALATEAVFSFSSKPLTLAIKVGLFLTLCGFIYFLYILYAYITHKGLIAGWASLLSTLLILNGFQLIFIGLIGEYISKIFEEVKGRPIYIIKEFLNENKTENSPHA
jgi:polyisoprenyl-phosphate glycosyltransferase